MTTVTAWWICLLHRDVNPISHCCGGKESGTQSHWHQGGFASWNNARNRVKLLITGGRNCISNPKLALPATEFFFAAEWGDSSLCNAFHTSVNLLEGSEHERRDGSALPSHTQSQSCCRTKSLHYCGCRQPRTPCWTGLHTGAAVREMWCKMAWIQLDGSHKAQTGSGRDTAHPSS